MILLVVFPLVALLGAGGSAYKLLTGREVTRWRLMRATRIAQARRERAHEVIWAQLPDAMPLEQVQALGTRTFAGV